LLTDFKQKISKLTLVPSGGGCFEVTVGDELIYSKLKTGTFPDEQAIVEGVTKRLKK
jgi:selenoprotein W-related protein